MAYYNQNRNQNRNQQPKRVQSAYPTRLVDMPIYRCTDAPKKLGKRIMKDGQRKVPVVFNPTGRRLATIVIPKGYVALVNRFGEYVGQWGAGFKWAAPWMTISHLLPEQSIIYDT
eukprot:509150_1